MTHPNRQFQAVALTIALALAGCDEETGEALQAPTPDAGTQDTGTPDIPDPEPEPEAPACDPGEPFEIDPGGPNTQIHAASAFDGEGIWVVYDLPGEDGNFDVHAVRLGCSGEALAGPLKVSTTVSNNVDPDIAISGQRVLFAWAADSGEFPNNLTTLVRTVDLQGQPIKDADQTIITTREGLPQTVNAWMVKPAAKPDGGFVLAGVRGLEAAMRFQYYLQPLTPDGDLDGEAFDGFFEAEVSQTETAVAITADGTIHAAWTRGPDEGDSQAVHTAFGPQSQTPTPAIPVTGSLDSPSGVPSLSSTHDGAGAWLAFAAEQSGDLQIAVKDASDHDPSSIVLYLGVRGEADHTPIVAPGPEGGAVAWHRTIRGFRTRLMIAPFTDDGSRLIAGPEAEVTDEQPSAPYQPALTHVGGGVYFLAWSEGMSPDFRIKAMFIKP